MEIKYRAEATTLEGFIQQLAAGYLCRGYRFYFQGLIPRDKDPGAVDAKLIARYGLGANRQLIAKLLPTADRSVFVVSGRQLIASISGGRDCSSRRSGSRSLLTLRWLYPRVGVGDHAGNLKNRRRITCCAA